MTVVSVLPLAHPVQAGKLYLANIGVPANIYKEAGIKFASPFGAKFVIPLHPR
jgi:enhancer of mRNA-decapping protein 3